MKGDWYEQFCGLAILYKPLQMLDSKIFLNLWNTNSEGFFVERGISNG